MADAGQEQTYPGQPKEATHRAEGKERADPGQDPATPGQNRSPKLHQLLDDELAKIIAAWPRLPESVRRGIVALVEETRHDTENE